MRIFKNVWFNRFARRSNIADKVLIEAIARAEKGLIDADLGNGVIKQRIARPGKGKSSGYRTIIFFKLGDRAFFVYGFAKNDRDNIEKDELDVFKKAAKELLALSEEKVNQLLEQEALYEVRNDN